MKKQFCLVVGMLLSISAAQAENEMQADAGLRPTTFEHRQMPDVKMLSMNAVTECLYGHDTNDARQNCIGQVIEKVAKAVSCNE